jgi:hypothetical protein
MLRRMVNILSAATKTGLWVGDDGIVFEDTSVIDDGKSAKGSK